MSKKLTAAAVERLKAGAGRREVPDGGCPGLYLVIQSSGVKSWAWRGRRPGGKTAKVTLGRCDLSSIEVAEPVIGAPLALAAARRLATELSHRRAKGEDVVATRRRERAARVAANAKTFGGAVFDFIEQHAKRNTRHWEETGRLLGVQEADDGGQELIPKGLATRWQDRPLGEIGADDIFEVVDEAREKGVPGLRRRAAGPSESQALKLYATLSKFFNWAVERRRVAANPVSSVARPQTPKARDRVLNDAEIQKFWKAAAAERREVAAVLKLLLLTGQRLNEAAGMRREELSADLSTWTIPGERTKNGRPHVVPLPPLARQIVEACAGADFVFTTDGEHAPAVGSKVKNRLDELMAVPAWRLHDLRRTAVTGMAELGIRPDVVELVVNHVSGHRAGVAGVYDRSEKLSERRAALERWAAHVEVINDGRTSADVVSIDVRRA